MPTKENPDLVPEDPRSPIRPQISLKPWQREVDGEIISVLPDGIDADAFVSQLQLSVD